MWTSLYANRKRRSGHPQKMLQIGAALTDWGVAFACFIGMLVLHWHSSGKSRPPYYLCFMGVFLAEGVACFGGGFMWSSGTNKVSEYPRDLSASELFVNFLMIVGMAAEGLMLILTHIALRDGIDWGSFLVCSKWVGVAFVGCCSFYWLVALMDWPFNVALQLVNTLPCGLLLMLFSCVSNLRESSDAVEVQSWCQVCAGIVLNLIGAAVLGVLDNDCTGISCITEYIPWESSPCRYAVAVPHGASCPLPEWFNHSAIMHVCAIASCVVTVRGLRGLLDCGWQSRLTKTHGK